jgi:iron(III) transport system permease protein
MSSVQPPALGSYSPARKIKNAILNIVTNPYNIITLAAIVLLAYLIVVPLLDMIGTTFQLAQRDLRRFPGAATGDFTLYYWNRLLASEISSSILFRPLLNSLFIAISVSVLSISLGAMIAWLMVRSNLPGK